MALLDTVAAHPQGGASQVSVNSVPAGHVSEECGVFRNMSYLQVLEGDRGQWQ